MSKLANFCKSRTRVPRNDLFHHFFVPQNVILVKPFSSRKSSPGVRKNASEKSFIVSYLVNLCGMSLKSAISASDKMTFKPPKNPDAVINLLKDYGCTDAHIRQIITKWPDVLSSCPDKTLLPKLDFFRSIGVPLPTLAHNLSVYPFVLRRSLKNALIPSYNDLENLLGSSEKAAHVFSCNPRGFGISSTISVLRERGVPESSIVMFVLRKPTLIMISKERFARHADRAIEMGFDTSKIPFINAMKVFSGMNELTLKRKMEVHRMCGWSESDTVSAFLRYPSCLKLSEKKITDSMDFLVSELGCEPVDMANRPVLLGLSLEKRLKPRCLVARVLEENGLWERTISGLTTLLKMTEKEFLKRFIVKYEKEVPEILDIYRGKL
ncbi:hypothetical protein CASFOL_009978 [Castilleja foliolosa]|uniref:Mitochondrial transcription termination factor n=1 Tax=Castilleja foliolosa TaxID=1961234 RepID=A0ABD3DR80_9LAMI